MLQAKSRTWVEIDLNKIRHNTELVQKRIGNTKIMAVVKADCYGHGDVNIARMYQDEMGIDFFAVSSVDEAVHLRENGIYRDILILGYTPVEHFHYLHELNITQCLFSLDYAKALDAYACEKKVVINGHVKIDTGMQRLGIPCMKDHYEIEDVVSIYELKHVKASGIFSHYSVSDDLEHEENVEYSTMQTNLFNQVLTDLKKRNIEYGITHMQNSYGCLNYFDMGYDYARPGIILLGSTSNDQDRLAQDIDLKQSLTWCANVSLVKTIKKGSSLGYGRNFIAKQDTKVATITVGYADGLNRNASHKNTCVLVHGKRCPIIGNICMDQCMVDVSGVENIQSGDIVYLTGESENEVLKIDELSRCSNTINNETYCLISKRVPRFYK